MNSTMSLEMTKYVNKNCCSQQKSRLNKMVDQVQRVKLVKLVNSQTSIKSN